MPIWKIRKTDQTTKCYFPYTRRKDSRDHRNGTLPHSRPDEMNNHVAVGGGEFQPSLTEWHTLP